MAELLYPCGAWALPCFSPAWTELLAAGAVRWGDLSFMCLFQGALLCSNPLHSLLRASPPFRLWPWLSWNEASTLGNCLCNEFLSERVPGFFLFSTSRLPRLPLTRPLSLQMKLLNLYIKRAQTTNSNSSSSSDVSTHS